MLLPFCQPCGIFLVLVWQVAGKPTYSHLTVRLIPKPEHATHTEENQLGEYQRQVDEQPLTDPTQHQPNTSGHKDAAGQILSYFSIKGGFATTAELRQALDCTHESLNNAINKLINDGKLRKVKRGVYTLRDWREMLWVWLFLVKGSGWRELGHITQHIRHACILCESIEFAVLQKNNLTRNEYYSKIVFDKEKPLLAEAASDVQTDLNALAAQTTDVQGPKSLLCDPNSYQSQHSKV